MGKTFKSMSYGVASTKTDKTAGFKSRDQKQPWNPNRKTTMGGTKVRK